jgi:hypothetical protein
MCACAATVLGAIYSLDATSRFRNESGSDDRPGDDVTSFQKPVFLDCVKRRQIQSDHHALPLRYGAPLYRCADIGELVVIVDPSTRRVIQVIENRAGRERQVGAYFHERLSNKKD